MVFGLTHTYVDLISGHHFRDSNQVSLPREGKKHTPLGVVSITGIRYFGVRLEIQTGVAHRFVPQLTYNLRTRGLF